MKILKKQLGRPNMSLLVSIPKKLVILDPRKRKCQNSQVERAPKSLWKLCDQLMENPMDK